MIKLTNRRLKKGKKVFALLTLALVLTLSIPFACKSIFADSNTISITLDDTIIDGKEYIICTNYTVNYNGETYVSKDADVSEGCNFDVYSFEDDSCFLNSSHELISPYNEDGSLASAL